MCERLLLPQDSLSPSEEEVVHLSEYQLYAVQNWIVDRNRLSSLLIVYTGDPTHSIRLTPSNSLPCAEAAKPRLTPHGTLMVTSLAHFRSDYTIVLIPNGHFAPHRDPLYANINLLRIGSSGRSALTLEHPSDTTKDRFISTFHLPDSSKDPLSFVPTVLQLVKLIQAGLAIFAMFSHPLDGLLCNDTLDGIRQWLLVIGGPLFHLQPNERVLDPVFVTALLSLVLSTRNKLAYLGYSNILPQDPFLHPHVFSHALASYSSSSSPAFLTLDLLDHISAAYEAKQKSDGKRVSRVIRNKLVLPVDSDGPDDRDIPDRPHPLSHPSSASLTPASSHGIGVRGGQILTGLATGIATPSVSPDASALFAPLLDLNFFIKFITAGEDVGGAMNRKETKKGRSSEHVQVVQNDGISGVGASVKALWTGRVLDLQRMRDREMSGGLAPFHFPKAGKRTKPKRGTVPVPVSGFLPTSTDALRGGVASDGDESWGARFDSAGVKGTQRYDGRSTEEESDVFQSHSYGGSGSGRAHGGFRWGGKLGSWAGLKKRKHQSVDLSATSPVNSQRGPFGPFSGPKGKAKEKPKERVMAPPLMIPPAVPPKLGSPIGLDKGNLVKRPSRRSTVEVAAAGATPVHRLGTRAQSPTLPPLRFLGELDADIDDDDLLSSGQVSPLSDSLARPNLFHGNYHRQQQYRTPSGNSSVQATSVNSSQKQPEQTPLDDKTHSLSRSTLTEEGKKRALAGLGMGRRPRDQGAGGLGQGRIASWADPVSARERGREEEEEEAEVGGNTNEDGDEGEGGEEGRAASPSPPVGSSGRGRGRIWMKKRTGEDVEEEESDISELRDQLAAAAATAGENNTGGAASALSTKWRQKAKPRFHSLLSVVDGEGQLVEEEMGEDSESGESDDEELEEEEEAEDIDEEEEERRRRRSALFDSKRRRSFHDLDMFRNLEVLSPTRMKIDVDLCGQCLIMWRRERHLKNAVACVNLLSRSLSHTNTALRSHAESHLDAFDNLAERSKVLVEMDEESHRAERFSQATNALRYESAQFHVQDLWRAAGVSRRRVWVLREKVFGLGSAGVGVGAQGRKKKAVAGAQNTTQGPSDRSLWTLDGRREVVDYLGRTESEAAEERRIDPEGLLLGESLPEEAEEADVVVVVREGDEDEDEAGVVELPGIKPMWLLRFFTSWRARWSAATSHPSTRSDQGTLAAKEDDKPDSGATPAVVSSPEEMLESFP